MTTSQKRLLTPVEFHQALGGAIGRSSIYELLRANRIRHVRVGRKLLIPAQEVDDFIQRETQEGRDI